MAVPIAHSPHFTPASPAIFCVDSKSASGCRSPGTVALLDHRLSSGRSLSLSSFTSLVPSSFSATFIGRVAESQQRLVVRAADDDSFFSKGTQFFKFGGQKEEPSDEPAAGTQFFRLGGRKKKTEEPEEASNDSFFGTQKFKFNTQRGTKDPGNGTVKGGALVQRKESTTLDALSFGRGRRPDPKTVFVAGATGQTGARIAQQLLHSGFNVRGGVRDLFFAQQLAEFATQYGVLTGEEAKRLNAVEFDFKDVDSIAKALGNASKVVVTVGPTEDGPRSKVTVEDALLVLEAAELANAGHFVVVCKSGAGSSNEGPLSGISTFFSNLFKRGLASGDADIIERVVETDLNFTVIKTGSTEGVDDYSPETSNLVVAAEGATDTGGKVSKIQVASVVASVFSNINASENKVVEIASDPYASPRPIEEYLSAIPVDGRRAILEVERAEAEKEQRENEARELAEAEAREAAQDAQRASELAAKLEAETRRLVAEEARAAAFAAKAQAKAEAAAASVDGLTTKAKELGINTFAKTLSGQGLGSFVPKLEDVGARFNTIKGGEKSTTKETKRTTDPESATVGAGPESAQKALREFFAGLLKQETIFVEED